MTIEKVKPTQMGHGIDCLCLECEKIRKLIRNSVASGKVHLVATEEDKKRLYK